MQNYEKICDILANEECKRFINNHQNQDPAQIVLQYKGKIPYDASILAYIIKLYQKASRKLPNWVDNYCALTTKSYEQATSQIVALYKTTFIKGEKLLVLGGGLGVDEWAFSAVFKQVTSIDNDAELNKIVAFNTKKLSITNVERIAATAEDYLTENNTFFDCIYTDPDRRDSKGGREKTFQNSSPNIIALLPDIWKHTNSLIIKASPLIDITKSIGELGSVKKVRVIAQNNEVKEVLFEVAKDYCGDTTTIAANYTTNNVWEVYEAEQEKKPKETTEEIKYFYEPNVAIIKAGLGHNYAAEIGLCLIDERSYYYTSAKRYADFMGRVFSVIEVIEFSKRKVANYLKDKKITQANIAQRNFRLKTEEIKKLFTIKDGGDHYLFFTQKHGKALVFHCMKK